MAILFIILAFSLIFLTPQLRIGLYWDMEIINICIFVCTGFALILKKKPFPLNNLSLRYCLIGLLGLTPFIYNHNLYQQLFGSIQTQQGIIGALCLGGLAILFNNVTRAHYYIAFLSVILTTLWNIVSHPTYLNLFPDEYPFHFTSLVGGLCLFPLAYIIKTPTLPKRYLQMGIILACIILSQNKTLIGMLPLLGLLYFKDKIPLNKRMAGVFVLMVPIGFLTFNALSFHNTVFPSSASRHISQRIPLLAFKEEPLKILTGYGFGATGDTIQKHLTQLPIHMYKDGVEKPDWDGLNRIEFHTYNAFSEIMLYLGILGILALGFLWMLPIQTSTKENLFPHTILMMLWASNQSNWFIIPYQWAFDILFLQTLIGPNATISISVSKERFIKLILGSVLFCAGMIQASLLYLTNPIHDSIFGKYINHIKSSPEWLIKIKNTPHFPELLKRLNDDDMFSDKQRRYFLKTAGKHHFSNTALTSLNDTFENAYTASADAYKKELLVTWGAFLVKVAHAMPHRFDLLYPYYLILVDLKEHAQIKSFSAEILDIAPDNPLAQWFWNMETGERHYVNQFLMERWLPWKNTDISVKQHF